MLIYPAEYVLSNKYHKSSLEFISSLINNIKPPVFESKELGTIAVSSSTLNYTFVPTIDWEQMDKVVGVNVKAIPITCGTNSIIYLGTGKSGRGIYFNHVDDFGATATILFNVRTRNNTTTMTVSTSGAVPFMVFTSSQITMQLSFQESLTATMSIDLILVI